MMFVPWCRRCQASLWSILAAMPLNESRRDLSPERAGGAVHEIRFESWLEEMIGWGNAEENEDAR